MLERLTKLRSAEKQTWIGNGNK